MKYHSDKANQVRHRLDDIDAVARAVHLWLRVFSEEPANASRSQAFAGGLITGLCSHLGLDNDVRSLVAYAYALLDDHGKQALPVAQMMLRPAMAGDDAADFRDGEDQVAKLISLIPGLEGQGSFEMKYIGVSQCNAGWFFVALGKGDGFELDIFERFAGLESHLAGAAVALVDAAIGLTPNYAQDSPLDEAERPVNGASIAKVPARSTIYLPTRDAASSENGRLLQQGLSTQPWANTAKIREVEEFLRTSALHRKIREMDPEVAFWALNGKRELNYDKKTAAGFVERLTVLKQHCALTTAILTEARRRYSREDQLSNDAVLDALVGAVTATY